MIADPRECIICGDLAAWECTECYQVHGAGLNTIAFCEYCKKTVRSNKTWGRKIVHFFLPISFNICFGYQF